MTLWHLPVLIWLGAPVHVSYIPPHSPTSSYIDSDRAHPSSITVQTWPAHFALAPCPVTIQVRAIPLDTDREIHVRADGPLFYRASAWSINGATAPRTHRVVWRDLPAGTYQVIATIGPPGRVRTRAMSSLELL